MFYMKIFEKMVNLRFYKKKNNLILNYSNYLDKS